MISFRFFKYCQVQDIWSTKGPIKSPQQHLKDRKKLQCFVSKATGTFQSKTLLQMLLRSTLYSHDVFVVFYEFVTVKIKESNNRNLVTGPHLPTIECLSTKRRLHLPIWHRRFKILLILTKTWWFGKCGPVQLGSWGMTKAFQKCTPSTGVGVSGRSSSGKAVRSVLLGDQCTSNGKHRFDINRIWEWNIVFLFWVTVVTFLLLGKEF